MSRRPFRNRRLHQISANEKVVVGLDNYGGVWVYEIGGEDRLWKELPRFPEMSEREVEPEKSIDDAKGEK